ncbi:unnamed protein product [Haemonchus placei]|uniref:Uncharacterized protein n=1 Tax=Haemonchus placei TaxID=6290 RepID=A0A0N4W213_HAEPC|nr:unnamed protein product [Haemonchus placei]
MDLSDVSAMLDQAESTSSPTNADIMAALEHVVGRLHTLEAAANELLKRSEPRSSCIFCPVADNRNGHNTSRCNRFPDAVAPRRLHKKHAGGEARLLWSLPQACT